MGNGQSNLDKEGCEFGRMLFREVGGNTDDISKIVENLQNRPSWSISLMITLMSSLITGMAVALIAGG